jgi:hypothetical protein
MLIDRFPKFNSDDYEIETKQYTPKPYKKHLNLFKFHSWMPFYADVSDLTAISANVRPGATIMSQNHLSTIITTVGYEYSENNENIFHTKLEWRGWYPIIESKIDFGGRQKVYAARSAQTPPHPDLKNNFRVTNSIKLPLSYSSGRFQQFFQPSVSVAYNNSYTYNETSKAYDHGQTTISGRLYFSNSHRRSLRDIYPQWAQIVDIKHDAIYRYFNSTSLKTMFYFPGLLPNNSLRLRYEIESRGNTIFAVSNRISFPRGYYNVISKHLQLFSADYYFPLAYPDVNIGSLVYIKRLRGSIFGDYAKGKHNVHYNPNSGSVAERTDSEIFKSAGFEALADFHVFRLPFLLSGGAQVAWKNFSQQPTVAVLFNIELFGMAINQTRYWYP